MNFASLAFAHISKKWEAIKNCFKGALTADNWHERDQALVNFRQTLSNTENVDAFWKNASKEEQFVRGLRDLLPNILSTLFSIRTSLVLECLNFIEIISKHVDAHVLSLHTLEMILINLLKCCCVKKHCTTIKCVETTKVFLQNVGFHAKLFLLLCNSMKDKSPEMRQYTAGYIETILTTYGSNSAVRAAIVKPNLRTVLHKTFFEKGLSDAILPVRDECRKALVAYNRFWPEQAKQFISTLDGTKQRQLTQYLKRHTKEECAALVMQKPSSKSPTTSTSSSSFTSTDTVDKLGIQINSQEAPLSQSSCTSASPTNSSSLTKNKLKPLKKSSIKTPSKIPVKSSARIEKPTPKKNTQLSKKYVALATASAKIKPTTEHTDMEEDQENIASFTKTVIVDTAPVDEPALSKESSYSSSHYLEGSLSPPSFPEPPSALIDNNSRPLSQDNHCVEEPDNSNASPTATPAVATITDYVGNTDKLNDITEFKDDFEELNNITEPDDHIEELNNLNTPQTEPEDNIEELNDTPKTEYEDDTEELNNVAIISAEPEGSDSNKSNLQQLSLEGHEKQDKPSDELHPPIDVLQSLLDSIDSRENIPTTDISESVFAEELRIIRQIKASMREMDKMCREYDVNC